MHSNKAEVTARNIFRFLSWLRESVDPEELLYRDLEFRNLSGPKSLKDPEVQEAFNALTQQMDFLKRLPTIPRDEGGALNDVVWPHGNRGQLRGFTVTASGEVRIAKIDWLDDPQDPTPFIREIKTRRPNILDIRRYVEMGGRASDLLGLIDDVVSSRLEPTPLTIKMICLSGNSDEDEIICSLKFGDEDRTIKIDYGLLKQIFSEEEIVAGSTIPARAWQVRGQINIALGDPIGEIVKLKGNY